MQQFFGQVFVLCNRLRNGTGRVNFSGLNAPLLRAPAKLHHAAIGQSAIGNATCHGGIDNRAGGRAQAHILVQFVQLGQGIFEIKAMAFHGCAAQFLGQLECQTPDGFFRILHHHLENTGFFGGRGAAESDWTTRVRLQGQGDFFKGMGHARGLAWSAAFDGANIGKDAAQALLNRVVGRQNHRASGTRHDGFDGRMTAPQIGTAQRANS